MKNIILKNGIYGGVIVSAFMVFVTWYMKTNPETQPSMIIGFASMLLSFFFLFWGIKQQRDCNKGVLSFGKAFATGVLIALLIATIYVVVWLLIYYNFFPDFIEQYATLSIKNAKPEDIAKVTEEMRVFKEMYKNPIMVILLTYVEILPLGIVVALLSAFILKRK